MEDAEDAEEEAKWAVAGAEDELAFAGTEAAAGARRAFMWDSCHLFLEACLLRRFAKEDIFSSRLRFGDGVSVARNFF